MSKCKFGGGTVKSYFRCNRGTRKERSAAGQRMMAAPGAKRKLTKKEKKQLKKRLARSRAGQRLMAAPGARRSSS